MCVMYLIEQNCIYIYKKRWNHGMIKIFDTSNKTYWILLF